jgi:hypothetical protein
MDTNADVDTLIHILIEEIADLERDVASLWWSDPDSHWGGIKLLEEELERRRKLIQRLITQKSSRPERG